jgi:hypothetical protein
MLLMRSKRMRALLILDKTPFSELLPEGAPARRA